MESKGNEEVEVESNDVEDVVEDEDFVNGEDNDDKDYVPEVDEELDVSGDENNAQCAQGWKKLFLGVWIEASGQEYSKDMENV